MVLSDATQSPRGGRAARAREQATVMFADLSGFTAMSERLDPEAVTDIVNHCLAVLEAVVLACGGTVDKYVGDCVVAVWDQPDPRTAALQAGRAARGICAAVQAINSSAVLPVPLDVHVGLGSGPLIDGHVGGEVSGAFSIVGEAVVRAERIGNLSTRGQILVDALTHDATADALRYRALPPVTLPPHREPAAVYELTGLSEGGEAELVALVQQAITHAADPPSNDTVRIRATRDSERRLATVMFAEVSGFEALSRSLSPQLSLQLLNRCFNVLEPAVHACGGVVDKYIGETIMALFGVPNAIEHAPQRALNAAIEMRELLRRYAEEQGIAGRLHLHVGINTGLVIAGELGGRDTRAFTVIGDTVNVAARLKAASGDGDILVGSDTFRTTREQFTLEPLPPLALKGKERRVPAWRLTSARTQRMRVAPAAGGITSALVGRERELAAVARAVEPLAHGRGGILGVIGEAGIGKSRLMAELLRLPAIQAAQLLPGRSLSIGQGLSFHPL
jgi:class 3 adenylate cyclase